MLNKKIRGIIMSKDLYNGYETPYSNTFHRFSSKYEEPVTYEYDLPIGILESYIKSNKLENSLISNCINEFKSTKIDPDRSTFRDFIESLCDEEKIVDDKYLYKDLVNFINYAEKNNLMHKTRREVIEKFLNTQLFKDHSDKAETINSDEYIQIDYSRYEHNNFRKSYGNEVLNKLASRGGGIYMDSDAKICLRFSSNTKFKPYSKTQAETLLSTKLGFKIKINEEEVEMYVDLNKDLLLSEKIKG